MKGGRGAQASGTGRLPVGCTSRLFPTIERREPGPRDVLIDILVLHIPAKSPLERVAPLLCAGVTTYSPCGATA